MNGHERNPLDLIVIFKDALKSFCKVALKYFLVCTVFWKICFMVQITWAWQCHFQEL